MKKIYTLSIIACVIMLTSFSFGFNAETVNTPHFSISATKMQVLYVGLDNPLTVSVDGVSIDKIKIEVPTTHATVIYKEGKGFVVKPFKVGNCEVKISVVENGIETFLGSQMFRIKQLPDPTPVLLRMTGGEINKPLLLKVKNIEALSINFDFETHFNVVQYTVSACIGGKIVEITEKSSNITDEVRTKILSKLEVGDKVYFEDIKVQQFNDPIRKIGVMKFVVK